VLRTVLDKVMDKVDVAIHTLITAGIGALECDISMRNGTIVANKYARWRGKPWLIEWEPEAKGKRSKGIRATVYLPPPSCRKEKDVDSI